MNLKPLRQRVAQALYEEPPPSVHHVPFDRIPWGTLDAERQAAWLNDADRVIPIVVEACVRVVTQTDPEKPANFLFRREQLGNVLTGLFIGAPKTAATTVAATDLATADTTKERET